MSYTDAIKEAYASAPVDVLDVWTLELHHPTFIDDNGQRTAIRLAQAFEDYNFRLEPTAMLNPGEIVLFQKCAFDFEEPGFAENQVPSIPITVSGVSRMITGYLEAAIVDTSPIIVYLRPYVAEDPEQPAMDPPYRMELTNVNVDLFQVTGTLDLKDVYNFPFPNQLYTQKRFPGLVR
jgi:hypothetical protein